MEIFLQLLANGVILGSEYALLGISWGIIFNVTGTFHFAHAIVYTLGAYVAIFCFATLGLPFTVSCLVAVVLAAVVGMLIEILFYEPMRRRSATSMTILITSLGILIVVESLIPIFFGAASLSMGGVETQPISLGPVFFTNIHLAKVITTWALVGGLMAFLHFTRSGKALRAVGSNPQMAAVVGLNIRRLYLLAFAIGSAMVAIGGILQAMDTGAYYTMGTQAVIIAAMAVLLGGMGSFFGSALGGLFIGMAMSLSIWGLPSEWQLTIGFGTLVVVIALRPRGFLGGKVVKSEV
ncbi:MAG TPA: branched-chain amino acid ABC transporter permease [bacterium]|nr:branched-chain amino acid ABC transporter permease [bacterium]